MNLPSIDVKLKNKAPNKKGELPVIIQVIHNRKIYTKGVGVSIQPEFFAKGKVTSNDRNSFLKNEAISSMVRDIERKFYEAEKVSPITPDLIKSILAGDDVADMTLLALLGKIKLLYAGKISASTFQKYDVGIGKFNAEYPNIKASDITPQKLIAYEGKLNKTQKPTTTWNDLKIIRSLFNKGIEHGYISNYPFSKYKAPAYRQPKRNYIQSVEVEKIENWCDNNDGAFMLRCTAAWFVLACYSGMRYSDLKEWNESKLVKGNRLYFSDIKTETPHFVPIYPKLQKAIERVREFERIFENQVCNRNLKEIASSCKIDEVLTMHMARHTFAVTFLDNGGTKDVLQKLLGHKKIATTEIYGKITDKRIEDEAQKVFNR